MHMNPISSQPGSSNLGQLFSSTIPVLASVCCFNASMLQDWSVQTECFRSFKIGRDREAVLYWFHPNSKIHQATVPFTPPNMPTWWGEIIQILYFFHISTTKRGTFLPLQAYSAARIHAILCIPSDAVQRPFTDLQYIQGKPSNSWVCRQHFMYSFQEQTLFIIQKNILLAI